MTLKLSPKAMFGRVDEAVEGPVFRGTHDEVYRAALTSVTWTVWESVYGAALTAVDQAVARAVYDDHSHPNLNQFLTDVRQTQ